MLALITALFVMFPMLCVAQQLHAKPLSKPEQPSVENRKANPETENRSDNQRVKSPNTPCDGSPVAEPAATAKGTQNQRNPSDGLYRAYLWATIIGVAVALIGLGFLYQQVRAVRATAEIAIRGDRAWLFETDAPQCLQSSGQPFGCQIAFSNFGVSPAWIMSIGGSFQWIKDTGDLSSKPIYGHINWGSPTPVMPRESSRFVVTNQIGETLSIDNAKLAVFASIEYRDRFSLTAGKPRMAKICFISTDKNRFYWSRNAPRGYNEYT